MFIQHTLFVPSLTEARLLICFPSRCQGPSGSGPKFTLKQTWNFKSPNDFQILNPFLKFLVYTTPKQTLIEWINSSHGKSTWWQFCFQNIRNFQHMKAHLLYFEQFLDQNCWSKLLKNLLPNLHFIYIHCNCLWKRKFFTLMKYDS